MKKVYDNTVAEKMVSEKINRSKNKVDRRNEENVNFFLLKTRYVKIVNEKKVYRKIKMKKMW